MSSNTSHDAVSAAVDGADSPLTVTTASVPQPSLRGLLTLAGPMIVARATQAVDSFADTYQIHQRGEDAIVATATGALNCFGVIMLPLGIAFIISSFVSQLHGAGRSNEAPRYAWYGLIMAVVAGLLALASLPFIGPILGLFDYSPQVRAQMHAYMNIRMAALGIMVAVEVVNNYYGGLGVTRVAMVAGLISMVVNIFTNWLFIEGQLGAPALGVQGAALSSLLASLAAFTYVFGRFWRERQRDLRAGAPRCTFVKSEFTRVIRFGLPNGINWLMEFGAFQLFINLVMSGLGTVPLAAFNAVISINSLSFMPAFGIASAGSILAGQAIGGDRRDLVWPHLRLTMATAMVWMGVIGTSYAVFPHQLMALFKADNSPPQIVTVGATMLLLSAAWQLFDAVGMTIGETLRAAGDTRWTMMARMLLAWFVFVPAGVLVVRRFDGGAAGAMICLAGYLALLAGTLGLRFRSGKWRSLTLVEPTVIDTPAHAAPVV